MIHIQHKFEDERYSEKVRAAIEGRAAVEKVIQTHEDVCSAMQRDEIGDIDILWGYEDDSNRQYRNGYLFGLNQNIADIYDAKQTSINNKFKLLADE